MVICMEEMKLIGRRIKTLRLSKGVSQAELAEARINYADTVESWYGYYTDAEITDGYEMVVDIVYEGEYGHDKNNEILYVYKVNGKWSRIDVY